MRINERDPLQLPMKSFLGRILAKVFGSKIFTTRGALPNTLMKHIYYYVKLSIGAGVEDHIIAQVLHFDKSCLYQERFTDEAIKASFKEMETRFPAVSSYYLLTDKVTNLKDPRLINLKIGEIGRLGGEIKIFLLAFNSDENLRYALEKIHALDNAYYFGTTYVYPATRYMYTDNAALRTLQIVERRISSWAPYFYLGDSENLIQGIAATKNLDGDYLEIGVFKGKSAILALEYMKQCNIKRKSFFLDTYEGFTYKIAFDSQDAICSGTHTDTSIEQIYDKLSNYTDFQLIKCDITREPLPSEIKKVAIANIDVDLYEATRDCLEKVHPHIIEGGIIMCEDYGHTPLLPGPFFAIQQFLASDSGKYYTPVYLRSGYIFLIKHSS